MKTKKILFFLWIFFFTIQCSMPGAYALENVSWDSQEDFLRGAPDDNIDLNQSPGDIKLKQNVNSLKQTTIGDFDNGNDNGGIKIKDDNGGEVSLNEFYSYNEEGDARCHGYSYAMTPIYDEDSGLFYCGSFGSSADGLSVIDTKKTDNFLDDETLFTYSTTSDPAIASNDIWQIYLNKSLNLMYVGTDSGLSVIDTNGTNDPSDDELVNTYNTSSSPAIASNVVRYLDFDESTGLLYVSAYNGGLSVINTQNTAAPSDDILVVTYSTTSTPAIVGNRASFSLLDKTNNYLYIGTWNSGISVIDTKGTISAADDTLVRTYTTATTPHLNYAYIERIYLDKDENLLYVVAQSGAPGALNVVDLNNDTSFAYKVDGVYDTTNSSTGTIISSEPVLRSNSVSDVFVDKNTGYMYVSHYNIPDAMTVIDTNKTYGDPSDDVVYKVYGDSTDPSIPNYSYDNSGWRIGHNVQENMLFLTSGTVGHGGVYFIPLEERESYQGQYYSDYFKYSEVPSDSVSWQGNLGDGQTSIQIRSTEDDDLIEIISDFSDDDTSEYLGDYYGWGGAFQDATESEGTMKLSNPNSISCGDGTCEWVDFWFDTGKPDNYYPAGTIIKARIRANSDREFGSYPDYMIGDQWSSSSESFFGNEWRVVEFTASSSFSKIGFDFNWKTGTWDDVNDSFEIDWIKAYSGPVNWGEWSDACVNNFGCEIPKSENDKYFQYRLNMSGDLGTLEVSDVTLSSGYQPSGTYVSENRTLSGDSQELKILYVEKTVPESTDINLEYSLDDGVSWVDIGNVEEYSFPEKTQSQQFKWRAVLTTTDSNETPILHKVSFNQEDPEEEEKQLSIELLDIKNITADSVDLKVDVSNYDHRTLDFKVRVRNVATDETEEVKFIEKVKSDGKITLTIEDLLPGTEYTFKVKVSEEDENDYTEYSNTKRATTEEESEEDKYELMAEPVISEEPILPETKEENPVMEDDQASQPESEPTISTEVSENDNASKNSAMALLEDPRLEELPTALKIIGLVTGASMAIAATTVPFLPASPTPVSDANSRFISLFGMLGRKKKKDDWGVVFDAQTRRPIAGAKVSIIGQNKNINSTTTDQQGRFGFLANAGTYTFQIFKDNYKLSTKDEVDELYGDLYTGQAFTIEEGEMARMNIAMQSTQVNWKDFAQRKLSAYTSLWSVIKKDFFIILFYTGFIASAAILYFSPTILNITIILIYLAMLIYNLFFKTKSFGMVTNQENKPVPFSVLSFYQENQPDKRIAFTVSDVFGRYYQLIQNGKYLMKVQGQTISGQAFSKALQVEVKDGVVREDVVV